MIECQYTARKVAILGPESSGKTTLARHLAERFGTRYANEYVRGYLRRGKQIACQADLYRIARKQIEIEDKYFQKVSNVLFCDTDLINLKIWSDEVFGGTDPRLLGLISTRTYSLCLLLLPNVTWSHDGLRSGRDNRERILQIYRQELLARKLNFVEIKQLGKARYDEAAAHILKHLSS